VLPRLRGSIPKQAANSGVGSIDRLEYTAANDWDVTAYRRDRRVPESVVARTFAGIVTALGERCWVESPHSFASHSATEDAEART
jgi:hypothetical protein